MKIALAALGALVLGAPAFAQDFSGLRIEGNVGWDQPRVHIDTNNFSAHEHDSGVVYGGEAGYDLRFNNLVVGAVAGVDGSSAKNCDYSDLGRTCLKQGRDYAVGARAGVVVNPRLLVYGKAQYVNVKLKGAFDDATDAAQSFGDHINRDGYRLAAGAELALARNLYVKAEYRYTDYRSTRYDFGGDVGRADLSRNQIVGGVGLRF
jgi:outer membrane immunogenic protein